MTPVPLFYRWTTDASLCELQPLVPPVEGNQRRVADVSEGHLTFAAARADLPACRGRTSLDRNPPCLELDE